MRQVLARGGIQAELIESTINTPWLDLLQNITGQSYTHILFSAYIWNEEILQKIIPLVRKLRPDVIIIVGGPAAAYNAHADAAFRGANLIVRGQGEGFVTEYFLDSDAYRKTDAKSCATWTVAHPLALDDIPYPYTGDDDLKNRLAYYETSRGCPFACAYCLSAAEEERLDFRDLRLIREELPRLAALQPKIVKLVDRTFNYDSARFREIWKAILALDNPVPFHFEVHPALLEEADFALLEKTPPGIFFLECGIQSIHDDVLKNVNRSGNWPLIHENLRRLCAMKNLHIHLDQIAALPGDTLEKARSSFNAIISLEPDEFQLGFLKLLPGTPLAAEQEKWGLVTAGFPPWQCLQTADLGFPDMQRLLRRDVWVDAFYNSGYFRRTLTWAFRAGVEPWDLAAHLELDESQSSHSRQWAPLAELLWNELLRRFPGEEDYIRDLMVFDWFAIAPSQQVPRFLTRPGDGSIREDRANLFAKLCALGRRIEKTAWHHSILFIPESGKLRAELDDRIGLFLWQGAKNRVLEFIDRSILERPGTDQD